MHIDNKLSPFWNKVQYKLFPQMEKDVGKLSTIHKQLISLLELIRIESFVPYTPFNNGRPAKDRACIARAFIAKIVFKQTYTKQIIELLKTDKQLRVICGWDFASEIPSESKFSRVFKEFASSSLPDLVHQNLIKEFHEGKIIFHVVKDSVPLETRERHLKKESAKIRKSKKNKKNKKELNRRQKQLIEPDFNVNLLNLPKYCDKGMKRSAQGYTKIWKGYKLHAAISDECLPLAVIITSASLNDCEVAIPLATKTSKVATNFYDLMDAAYFHEEIKAHSISIGHVPIIDPCPNSKLQKIEKEKEAERKKLLNFKTAEDIRYKERLPKERFNALYKDYYGGKTILYRGYEKVFCHVMFGVLALAASTIIKLI